MREPLVAGLALNQRCLLELEEGSDHLSTLFPSSSLLLSCPLWDQEVDEGGEEPSLTCTKIASGPSYIDYSSVW